VPFPILIGTTLTTVLHYRADCDMIISRKRYDIASWFLLNSNRKSYAVIRMVMLPMTLGDP